PSSPTPVTAIQVNVQQPSRAAHSLGIASLVLGILSFFVCWLPFIGLFFGGLGFVLGGIGLLLAFARKGSGVGFSIAGTAVSSVALVTGLLFTFAIVGTVASVDQALKDLDSDLSTAPPQAAPVTSDVSATAPPSYPTAAKAIPDDVTYTIIDKNIVPGIKRSLDIQLNRKVSEDVLKSIAMKLKNSDPKSYERTFIGYYLPGMKVNSGSWATTHFNPNLEVRILGLTVEQEEALNQQPADPSREIIGNWLDERPSAGIRITIFRKNGKLFMENKYRDGSAGIAELSETRSQDGRRFDYKPDRGNSEYYLINSKGELQQLDQDGPFMTAKKVN
ncbi:MAG: hypothetical protein J3T61_12850, partial [Candidatus Brocadiales bacterium]|nr:hypothetical protein [Candidatus Bathyanammoxibius sp.]